MVASAIVQCCVFGLGILGLLAMLIIPIVVHEKSQKENKK